MRRFEEKYLLVLLLAVHGIEEVADRLGGAEFELASDLEDLSVCW